jgi:hypothetical protein
MCMSQRRKYLYGGLHSTEVDAAQAYNRLVRQLLPPGAHLNDVPEGPEPPADAGAAAGLGLGLGPQVAGTAGGTGTVPSSMAPPSGQQHHVISTAAAPAAGCLPALQSDPMQGVGSSS